MGLLAGKSFGSLDFRFRVLALWSSVLAGGAGSLTLPPHSVASSAPASGPWATRGPGTACTRRTRLLGKRQLPLESLAWGQDPTDDQEQTIHPPVPRLPLCHAGHGLLFASTLANKCWVRATPILYVSVCVHTVHSCNHFSMSISNEHA